MRVAADQQLWWLSTDVPLTSTLAPAFVGIDHKGAATIVNLGRAGTRDHRYRIDHRRAAAIPSLEKVQVEAV
jgi:hypothetical protein